MFRNGIAALLRNGPGLFKTSAGPSQEILPSHQFISPANFMQPSLVSAFASKAKKGGKKGGKKSAKGGSGSTKCKPVKNEDLIKCPPKSEAKSCKIDLTPPKIGYYNLGYCRPPCWKPPKGCPPRGKAIKKGSSKCCKYPTSKFKINPCKKPPPCP